MISSERLKRICVPVILVLVLASCDRNPASELESKPSEIATTRPSEEEGASRSPEASIFYAQVGNSLNSAGYIAESLAILENEDAVYAMAVFRGEEGARGFTGVTVTKSDDTEILKDSREYTIADGETAVVFNVAPADGGLADGDYKVLFTCNGGPCWEILFTVR